MSVGSSHLAAQIGFRRGGKRNDHILVTSDFTVDLGDASGDQVSVALMLHTEIKS